MTRRMLPVHVVVQHAAELPAGDGWLSAAEQQRLAGFRIPKRRAEWRMGRYAAKCLLAARLADPLPLTSIVIEPAADGAPEAFGAGSPLDLTLSISHNVGLAFCAVAPGRVQLGCDVERIEPRSDAFVADYFTPEEQAHVLSAPEPNRPLLANLIWSAKESTLKALREGLRLDTRQVQVESTQPREPEGWHPLATRCLGRQFGGWWRHSGEHVLTLVSIPAPAPPVLLQL
jgi:4'-phosphopantetheinyl transferase